MIKNCIRCVISAAVFESFFETCHFHWILNNIFKRCHFIKLFEKYHFSNGLGNLFRSVTNFPRYSTVVRDNFETCATTLYNLWCNTRKCQILSLFSIIYFRDRWHIMSFLWKFGTQCCIQHARHFVPKLKINFSTKQKTIFERKF